MPVRFEARERFAVAPEQLWPLVSDTQRLNRALGLPAIHFRAEPLPEGGARVVGEHPLGSAVLSLLGQVFPLGPRRVADPRLLRFLPHWPIVRWIEHPFEWEAPRRYAVRRDYFWSPLGLFPFRVFRGGVELVPMAGGGTEVIAFAEIEPRNPQGALLTRLVLGPRNVRAVLDQCRAFEHYLLGHIAQPFPDLSHEPAAPAAPARPVDGRSAPTDESRPAPHAGWDSLARAGVAPELIRRLRRHLVEAPDDEVAKMRPFALADRWQLGRRETLAAFLHATLAGVVEMTWDVLCPNCRIAKAEYSTLAALESEAHCESCNISFDALVDRQVEVRFTVSPAIRVVDARRFCSGGPMSLSHVVAQALFAPGEARSLTLALDPGGYRLRSPQCRSTAVLEVGDAGTETQSAGVATAAGAARAEGTESAEGAADGGGGSDGEAGKQGDRRTGTGAGQPPETRVEATALTFTLTPSAILPPLAAARAGEVWLAAVNETGVAATLVVERPHWPDTAATASVVGTLQEFRDLFGAEALAPGLQLSIQRLAFLFTDLTGSTALYGAIGQARAFRLVQDHFTILARTIAAHDGAIVKTIGDAVMATFPSAAEALAAALAMQRDIRQLDTHDLGGTVDTSTLLKVGVHEGPCIAVGANGRLDYFGTTINVAARVQHESQGGEVVLSADVYADPAVQALLDEEDLRIETAETRLRGVRDPVCLYRLTLPPVAAAGAAGGEEPSPFGGSSASGSPV